MIMKLMAEWIKDIKNDNKIDSIRQARFDENLDKLSDIVGGCESLIVVFIAYTFVAFEAIADEIEQPFGTEDNDLALNSMCLMIETTLLELAGEKLLEIESQKGGIID
jgi:putative membrane protein